MAEPQAEQFRVDDKVAVVTGAARGLGRAFATTLAAAGADIIALDLCATPETVRYSGATEADLRETARQVQANGRRAATRIVDVRDIEALDAAVRAGVEELGSLDIVCANAGIWAVGPGDAVPLAERAAVWRETIDINLTGVWNTVECCTPHLIAGGRGGSVVLTSSVAGLRPLPSAGRPDSTALAADMAYATSKAGLVGLMRVAALQLAPHGVRVNSVHPTGADTPLVSNDAVAGYAAQAEGWQSGGNLLPVDLITPADVAATVLYLASDAARYVTGTTLPVDAGLLLR